MGDNGVGRTPQRGIRMETDTATGQSLGWRRNEVGDDRQVGPGGKPERGEGMRERAAAEQAMANWAKEKGLACAKGERRERAGPACERRHGPSRKQPTGPSRRES